MLLKFTLNVLVHSIKFAITFGLIIYMSDAAVKLHHVWKTVMLVIISQTLCNIYP